MPFGGISAGSVFVKLGADLDRHGFDQFEKEHTKAAKAKDIGVRLGGDFDRRDLDRYQTELDKVQKRVARRDAFKAELGGDFNARAFRQYERELDKAERDTVKAQGRMRTAFGAVWGKGGAAFAAAGGAYAIVTAVKGITGAYADAEASQKRVETAVKNAGITYRAHAKQIDEVIQQQSKLAALDDEDLADSFGKIVGATKDVNEALRLNGLAADVARGRQISLEAANRLVIRAYQGNVGALKRLGIDLDPVTRAQDKLKESTKKATDEQVKAAKKADETATSQKALSKLQDQFGGQAEKYGKTQAGATDRLKVSWENLQENLGQKFAPLLTKVFNGLAAFIDSVARGTTVAGGIIESAARLVAKFGDKLLSVTSTNIHGLELLVRAASHLPIVGDQFKGIADKVEEARHAVDRQRESLRYFANNIDGQLKKTRQSAGKSLGEIRDTVGETTSYIRKKMGGDTERGAEALTKNFQAAVRAIQRSMNQGKIATRAGLGEIRNLLEEELQVYGMKLPKLSVVPQSNIMDLPGLGGAPYGEGSPKRAGGGWIGQPGMVGTDTVPAMLAPGEAVLNRHQQAVVEGLLGDGFLDMLFSRVNRPHYMAKGGIVPVPGFPGERAASSVIPTIEMIAKRFGLVLTDAFGQGHKSPGHTRFGTAADFAGSDAAMDRAVRFLVGRGYLVGYDGRFGSQAWPGHGPSSVAGANAHLHVELGGGGGALLPDIAAPRVRGGGALGRVVQGALSMGAKAANRALGAAAPTPVAGGGGGGYTKGALAGLWRQAGGPANISSLMAAIALAESGGRTRAHNPSGASGLWQILGQIVPGNIYDPMVNARNAVAKWRSQGLGAWEAYTNGSYRQYLAKGGRAKDAKGELGWLNKQWGKVARLWGLDAGEASLGSLFKHVKFNRNVPFVGLATDSGDPNDNPELLWPKWIWANSSGGQKALDPKSKLQLFIHEMAHRFQVPSQTRAAWLAEGGAEAFARITMNNLFGGSQRVAGDPYTPYSDQVLKKKGWRWALYDQFGLKGGKLAHAPRLFARGGRAVQNFASGGFAVTTPGARIAQGSGFAAPPGGFRLPKMRRLAASSLSWVTGIQDHIGTLEDDYSVLDRRFSLSDDPLVDEQGNVITANVEKRVGELNKLLALRQRIVTWTEALRQALIRARDSLRKTIHMLTKARASAKGKNRAGYTSLIDQYRKDLNGPAGVLDTLKDVEHTGLPMAQLDVEALQNEIGDVSGTQATGGGGGTADADAIAAQAVARADRLAGDLRAATNVITAFSSAGDIGIGGSSAFAAVGNANQATGAQFAGGTARPNVAGGAAGGNVYNFNMPGHPEVLRAIGDSAVSGISLQSSVSSSVERLGI